MEGGNASLEGGLDDRLEISLLDQVLAQQVAVVLEVEIADRLAGLGRLDSPQELGLGEAGSELGGLSGTVALELHRLQLGALELAGGRGALAPSKEQTLAGSVGEGAVVEAPQREQQLAAGVEPELGLVVLSLGRVEAEGIHEPDARRHVLAECEPCSRIRLPAEQLRLDVHRVEADVQQSVRDLARELLGEQRRRLLPDDAAPAAEAGSGVSGGDQADELFLRQRLIRADVHRGQVEGAAHVYGDQDVVQPVANLHVANLRRRPDRHGCEPNRCVRPFPAQ